MKARTLSRMLLLPSNRLLPWHHLISRDIYSRLPC